MAGGAETREAEAAGAWGTVGESESRTPLWT